MPWQWTSSSTAMKLCNWASHFKLAINVYQLTGMRLARGLHPDLVGFDRKSVSLHPFSSKRCRILMNPKDKFHKPVRCQLFTLCRSWWLPKRTHSSFGQVYLLGPQGIHLLPEGEWQNIFLSTQCLKNITRIVFGFFIYEKSIAILYINRNFKLFYY